MKVIAIMGEPGSGKTTLMRKIMEDVGISKEINTSFKLVPYHQKDNVYLLGKYEDGNIFAGTDTLSMAVQKEAIKFLTTLPQNSVVLFEGDRLCTASFLENCNDNYDLSIIYLKTDRDVRKARYEERGSNQNQTWLAGRESKISNILGNMVLKFCTESYDHNNIEEQNIIVKKVGELING
jgi:uridine kinase